MDGELFKFKDCNFKRVQVGPLEVNCYIVWDAASKEAAVIDPGGHALELQEELIEKGLELKYILNTHGHFDHVGGDGELQELCGGRIAIHSSDIPLLESAAGQSALFGFRSVKQPKPDFVLHEGLLLELGKLTFKVIHTPGHSEGGVCLYLEDCGVLFSGDTLFAGSIGRTDLPGGDYDTLISSINERVVPLGDHVSVFSGHGIETTIKQERQSNPFLSKAEIY